MPPDGYTTITVPDYLITRLDRHRADGDGYAEAIDQLIDVVEAEADGGDGDVLTPTEFEDRARSISDDVVSRTATRTADELEDRLR